MLENKEDKTTFTMFCPRCGKEYVEGIKSVSNNPVYYCNTCPAVRLEYKVSYTRNAYIIQTFCN